VKLLVHEEGSTEAKRRWMEADRITTSLLLYVEARAVVAAARRAGRLGEDGQVDRLLQRRYRQISVIDPSRELVREAGHLAERHALRGSIAVHLASALAAQETLDDLTLMTWDEDLARAARRDGLPVTGLWCRDP
jgi:uncharacterized protein